MDRIGGGRQRRGMRVEGTSRRRSREVGASSEGIEQGSGRDRAGDRDRGAYLGGGRREGQPPRQHRPIGIKLPHVVVRHGVLADLLRYPRDCECASRRNLTSVGCRPALTNPCCALSAGDKITLQRPGEKPGAAKRATTRGTFVARDETLVTPRGISSSTALRSSRRLTLIVLRPVASSPFPSQVKPRHSFLSSASSSLNSPSSRALRSPVAPSVHRALTGPSR